MKVDGDDLIFSTGKTLYANQGIIGISPDGVISEGYDDGIEDNFTPKERRELADYMITLWTKWRIK